MFTSEIYTLSLHDALPICGLQVQDDDGRLCALHDRQHLRRGRIRRRVQHDDVDEGGGERHAVRSEEHTSELQSRFDLVCRLLLEKKNLCTVQLLAYFISIS